VEQEPRVPRHRYADPLDELWLATAARLGFRVERSAGAYASIDGRGVMTLGAPETLDPDDCLAQMILHECCHWLVEGERSAGLPDWGLDNITDRDAPRERACLRLQAHLAGRHGLRGALAPTTDFRAFYDALPADALTPRHDPTVAPAIHALQRLADPKWEPLHEALAATGEILRRTSAIASSVPSSDSPMIWAEVSQPAGTHPLGMPLSPVDGRSCNTCAWHHRAGPGRITDRCRQADNARIDPAWPGCELWEDALDCRTCGACCRAAYGVVVVSPRDPVVKAHPDLIHRGDHLVEIRREGDRCAALEGGAAPAARDLADFRPYTCSIYEDRPRPCRDFEVGGGHCLTARRRVGLTV
jgi:hypothetical protein